MSTSSTAGKLVRAALGSAAYTIAGNLFVYLGQVVIARELSRSDYATFSVVIAFTSLAAMFADLGWTSYLSKRFAQAEVEHQQGHQDTRGVLLGSSLLVKLALSVFITVIGYVIGREKYGSEPALLILLTSITFTVSSRILVTRSVFEAFLRAEGRFETVAKLSALDAAAFAVLLYVLSHTEITLLSVILVYSLCHLPGFALLIQQIRGSLRQLNIRLRLDARTVKEMFVEASPLMIGTWLMTIHNMADTLLLKELSNDQEVSAYGASLRLMAALTFLPAVVSGVIIPAYVKFVHGGHRDKAVRLTVASIRYLLVIATGVALGVSAFAPYVVRAILGAKYADASDLVVMVTWIFVPSVFSSFILEMSIAVERQRVYALYFGALAFLTVVCDLLVAHALGARGVLICRLGSITLASAALLTFSKRHELLHQTLGLLQLGSLATTLFFSGIGLVGLHQLGVPDVLAGAAAVMLFAGGVLLTRFIDLGDLRSIMRSLRGGNV